MDGLELEYKDQMRVIRVDVQSAEGKEIARQYGSFTPTFVFFDPQGEEVWRAVGSIDPKLVRQHMP